MAQPHSPKPSWVPQIVALVAIVTPPFLHVHVARDAAAHGGMGLSYRIDMLGVVGAIICLSVGPTGTKGRPRSHRAAVIGSAIVLGVLQLVHSVGIF
jgi:hypothetical protein